MFDIVSIKNSYHNAKRTISNSTSFPKYLLIVIPLMALLDVSHIFYSFEFGYSLRLFDYPNLMARMILIFCGLSICLGNVDISKRIFATVIFLGISLMFNFFHILYSGIVYVPASIRYPIATLFSIVSMILTVVTPFIFIFILSNLFTNNYIGFRNFEKKLPEMLAVLILVLLPILFCSAMYLYGAQFLYSYFSTGGGSQPITSADHFIYYVIESPYHLILKPILIFSFFMTVQSFIKDNFKKRIVI